MRKVLPRIFNVLSFILALFIILPIAHIVSFFVGIIPAGAAQNFVSNVAAYEWTKILFIPLVMVAIAFIFLIVSSIDFRRHDKLASHASVAASLNPIAYLGIAGAICGMFVTLVYPYEINLSFYAFDYFGLGQFFADFINPFFSSSKIFSAVFYGALLLVQLLLLLLNNRLCKRGFFVRLLVFILYLILAFVSLKGIHAFVQYNDPRTFVQLLDVTVNGLTNNNMLVFASLKFEALTSMIIVFGVAALALVLYVFFAIVRAHKNNVREKEERVNKPQPKKAPAQKEENKAVEEFTPSVSDLGDEEDSLFAIPKPEDEIVTEIEEKTVVKQVIYEKSDLNNVFSTEFGFKNTSMVKRDGYTDYFVNKQKFLTLSNGSKTISFRLELDKAIRLIIQYPLIGKDKYENHKIWFKIDDYTILNKETVISIVKDAYTTVLNNQ
ncbi:MAG: hypothetical protein K6G38_04645 [Gammaproteobacteria bacterium]|nr:hypothetical protein [Gammaproteobacteria bacterium]